MKKLYTFSIIILLFITGTTSLFSQYTPFTAKEGKPKAMEYINALDNAELYELKGVSCFKGTVGQGQVNVYQDGTADAWMYYFENKTDPLDRIAIGVVNIGIYQALPIDVSYLEDFILRTSDPIDLENADDSDTELLDMTLNETFYNFFQAKNAPEIQVLGLSVNKYDDGIPNPGNPYWMLWATNLAEDQLGCYGDPFSGDVICQLITSVDEVNADTELKLYPNPATDFALLDCPQEFAGEIANVFIFNELGEKVIEMKNQTLSSTLMLPVRDLNSGVYFVEFVVDNIKLSAQLVINK